MSVWKLLDLVQLCYKGYYNKAFIWWKIVKIFNAAVYGFQ